MNNDNVATVRNAYAVAERSEGMDCTSPSSKALTVLHPQTASFRHRARPLEIHGWRLFILKNNGDEVRQCIPDSCALVSRFFPRSIPSILLAGWYH
jgi:hypothetical protein